MSAKVRPAPMKDIEDNGAPPEASTETESGLPPSPANKAEKAAGAPTPPLSPNSQFHKIMSGVEAHMADVMDLNKYGKKLSQGAAAALNAFMSGGSDHKREESYNHVVQEILRGARNLQVKRVRKRLQSIPEYANYIGAPKEPLSPQPTGNQFKVSIVLDPYGMDKRSDIFVTPDTTLGQLYEENQITLNGSAVPFEKIAIMIHGAQAPVGYKSFTIDEFDLGTDIGTIFIAPLVDSFVPDPVLDSPTASAYKTLNPAWYIKS